MTVGVLVAPAAANVAYEYAVTVGVAYDFVPAFCVQVAVLVAVLPFAVTVNVTVTLLVLSLVFAAHVTTPVSLLIDAPVVVGMLYALGVTLIEPGDSELYVTA